MTVKRVVSYLEGTLTYEIKFSKIQNFKLYVYSDSDWDRSTGDIKSILVIASLLNKGISHNSQRNKK